MRTYFVPNRLGILLILGLFLLLSVVPVFAQDDGAPTTPIDDPMLRTLLIACTLVNRFVALMKPKVKASQRWSESTQEVILIGLQIAAGIVVAVWAQGAADLFAGDSRMPKILGLLMTGGAIAVGSDFVHIAFDLLNAAKLFVTPPAVIASTTETTTTETTTAQSAYTESDVRAEVKRQMAQLLGTSAMEALRRPRPADTVSAAPEPIPPADPPV